MSLSIVTIVSLLFVKLNKISFYVQSLILTHVSGLKNKKNVTGLLPAKQQKCLAGNMSGDDQTPLEKLLLPVSCLIMNET